IDVVLRVSARADEAVVAVAALGAAVVHAQRVASGEAVAAMAAALVRFAGDAVADGKTARLGADGDDFARPFVARRERVGRRPDSGEAAANDFGVAAADRHGANFA